jgi:hypothetical protein
MIFDLLYSLLATVKDVVPIAVIIFGFQLLVLRRAIVNLPQVIVGFIYVIIGLTFFLYGLEKALFPLGRLMAEQLTEPSFTGQISATGEQLQLHWWQYRWVYLFAFAIGFATTIAEPSLLAVAIKANQVSGGTISTSGLRIAVAIGVAIGISIGTYRIVSGTPLYWYIIVGYIAVILQSLTAPKSIIALAYDSGGVTTSTVTVPIVTALGLGLASTVPGRNPVLDGFGLIAFASLFPIIAVMCYAQLSQWRTARQSKRQSEN